MVERSKSFASVKSASLAIAFFQKVNMFDHLPTQSPAVNMVREATARKFGLTPKGRQEAFTCSQVVAFTEAYGVNSQGYCDLVVATMVVVMFGTMCRYNAMLAAHGGAMSSLRQTRA
jgi:hypothetical protein